MNITDDTMLTAVLRINIDLDPDLVDNPANGLLLSLLSLFFLLLLLLLLFWFPLLLKTIKVTMIIVLATARQCC